MSQSPEFLEELDARGVTYFASGSNHPGDIKGLADIGVNPGATVVDLVEGAELAAGGLAGTGVKFFLDSGAFGEVKFGPTGPSWPKPITHQAWLDRFKVYKRLGRTLGEQLYAVAPDQVANQLETYERQHRYRDHVRELHDMGVNILVPLQKGEDSMATAERVSAELLGFSDFIPSIPMKKDATSLEELARYLDDAQPARLHLLGMGAKSKKIEKALSVVDAHSPHTEIFLDSVLIRGSVQRKEVVRPLTRAQDIARGVIRAAAFRADLEELPDYTDFIAEPEGWMTKTGKQRFVRALGLKGAAKKRALANLDAWLQECEEDGPCNYELPQVEGLLDELWYGWVTGVGGVEAVKRMGIRGAFGGEELSTGEDVYAFEGQRTKPEAWTEELEELRDAGLHVDVTWPEGVIIVHPSSVGSVLHELQSTDLWEEVDPEGVAEHLFVTSHVVELPGADMGLLLAVEEDNGLIEFRLVPYDV